MSIIFNLYHQAIERRPIATRMATTAALFAIGDVLSQYTVLKAKNK